MIPKIIHYCWISGEDNMPADIKKCIESWHIHLPDYQFINWNDSNFDWNICEFTKYCRENNFYAFCADYVRFWAIYNYGGFYLDTDVTVYKSFDELLKLKRVIAPESMYPYTTHYDAGIIGGRKGDVIFKDCIDWYHNNKQKFDPKGYYVISPFVMDICWKDKYTIAHIPTINDEIPNTISLLDCTKYFRSGSNLCFARHNFKGEWCKRYNHLDCFDIDNYKIFLCAHKPITNHIPKDNHYVLLDTTGKVNNSFNDNFHEIIDISKDEFTKSHNVCYSEGCAIRWLWKHPEVIPDYICFGHYRRYFLDFCEGNEIFITRAIQQQGAIIKKPFNHTLLTFREATNKGAMYYDHQKDDTDAFIQSVKEAAPEYWNTFQELLNDHFQYACNCFAMKKEHFLEMCEMCFRVLDYFDEKMHYKNNEDVFIKMVKNAHTTHLRFGINWQSRLEGFWLEWLTELYYRQKFGVNNCYKSEAGIKCIENHKIYEYIQNY